MTQAPAERGASNGSFETLALYEAFPEERVLHEDADIVAIDKPFGLATHAPDEGRHDDVVSWLGAWYRARGASPYLGIHQRLDRETSGVVMFARRKEANPALAKQFEGHHVDKRYVAVVEGRLPAKTVLRHFVSEGDGQRRVARAPDGRPRRGEQEAVTRLEVLERAGKRSLVELVPETGRTHQLRVQLAAIGAPIVGDPLYGGAPDVRMMLHAKSLGFVHPSTSQKMRVEAPVPRELARALRPRAPEEPALLEALVREAAERRFGIVATRETNALRIVNGAGDGLDGATVDLYGRWAVLSIYDAREPGDVQRMAEAIVAAGAAGVYVKYRPKHASRVVDTRRDEIAPREPIAGAAAPEAFEIVELGVPYEVRLGDGLSTGIFLDQRENRRRVRELSKGKRVLNLFAYTGSFSVVAALGGAEATTTVDVSRAVLDWARTNLERVGAQAADHACVETDVFDFLTRAKAKKEQWDVVVLDPPSFSTTKRSTWSAEDDYDKLAAAALDVVAPGGKLLACTNHRGIRMEAFRKKLHRAAEASKRPVAQMKNLPPPVDFPADPGHEPHLKSVLVTLR